MLYSGKHGLVAHECIIDLRELTKQTGVTVDDVAKRLVDYGFHAPTMSFPVAGTLMIEPTESEAKAEIDRFCDAMISIRHEMDLVAAGTWPADDNPLHNARTRRPESSPTSGRTPTRALWPPTLPVAARRSARGRDKYWPPVARIDQAYGDRNLVCTCAPVADYATE